MLIASFISHTVLRKLRKIDIWLIKEKTSEARDNGYYLFKYLCQNHPEINAYYVIKTDTADYQKVKKIGKVIKANSFLHYVYYTIAKYSIGSQPFGAPPSPIIWNYRLGALCRKDQKVVFLQHGIIKDDLPGLYYKNTCFDLFVTSSEKEYEFVRTVFSYPPNKVKLLGLCRFDGLYEFAKEKTILVMPTFRLSLVAKDRGKPASATERELFERSAFYKGFSNLLSNKHLIDLLRGFGFKLLFYLHYSFQSYNECFYRFASNEIIIADREHYDVQRLLLDSSILITDFSSVFFDYAYMKKPEVFFQPDEAEYRAQHYKKGYFDYCLDGFGPVFTKPEDTILYLKKLIKNNCIMESIYLERADSFFPIHDKNNCERTYNAIKEIK